MSRHSFDPGASASAPLGRLAGFAAAYALAGGIATLLGWAFDVVALTDWDRDGVSQMPNSAVGVVACGLGLLLLRRGRRRAPAVLGAFAALVGAVTVLEHTSGWNAGIDRVLFARDWGQAGTVAPGRMGVPGSVTLALVGAAVALLAFARASRFVVGAGLVTIAITSLSLIGYLFGADLLYTLPRLTVIASQTSTMMFALGVSLVLSVREREPARMLGSRSAAGLLLRRAWPLLAFVTVLFGWFELAAVDAGLFDGAFGNALLAMGLLTASTLALWWAAVAIDAHERESLANRDRLLGVLEAVTDAVVVVDAEAVVQFANEAFRRRAVLAPAAPMVGRRLAELLPEIEDTGGAPLRDALLRREPVAWEARSRRDGRWYADRAFPTADGGVAVFSRDVTERKRTEEELVRLAQDLHAADRRKDEFLATLAHELRNPLAPIRNSVELLKRGPDRPEVVAGARATMERQLVNLVRLIDDLLDVSRISRDKLELRRERVPVAEVVRHAVETSAPLIEQAGHAFELVLPPEQLVVDADPVRLAQVVSNLLSNACRYTERGGRILLTVSRAGDEAVVSVRDNGIGIPPAMLESIFEMFVQLDRRLERARGGLGIGLTLVKRLVSLHGGRIEAYSEGTGAGSEFVVRLPLAAIVRETAVEATAQTTRE